MVQLLHNCGVVASPPPLILIPARMASTRLPGKMLADIAGHPMIGWVIKAALCCGDVLVATDDAIIAEAAQLYGAQAVMTNPAHPSGSDRIYEALTLSGHTHETVINLQGDVPLISPDYIIKAHQALLAAKADIATLVAPCDAAEAAIADIVKAVIAPQADDYGRALYFSRAMIPHGGAAFWHHIGIYAYRRVALERFVALEPSKLECTEKLEQLRALEAGMHIACAYAEHAPLGVDTPAQLEQVRAYVHAKGLAPCQR